MLRPSITKVAALCAVALAACAQGGFADAGNGGPDTGRVDAGRDAGRRDAGRDAGRVDSGPRDSGPVDSGADDAGPRDSGPRDSGPMDSGMGGTCTPTAANMVISEVMVASQSGSGDLGEWFEVHNRGTCAIALRDLVIESPTGGGAAMTHTVTSGLLTAGGFFVFAQSADAGENHGLDHDYAYGEGTAGVVLNNTDDELILKYMDVEIDRVGWADTTDYRNSISRQLARDGASADNSDLGSGAFCDSTRVYSTTGGSFNGSPGALNDLCP